jgi:transposase
MDAAHVVFAPVLGMVWCVERLLVQAPSGGQRVHGLAAVNVMTHEVLTVRHLTSMTAETVWAWLSLLASAHPGLPITIIVDNARYQRCMLVQTVAQTVGMEWRYVPTYSPNLNLMERFWKFVKQPCLSSKYDPDRTSFQQAIEACIEQAPTTHKKALESLLTCRFQTFRVVPVMGESHTVSQGARKKVLSKAA